MQQPQERPTPPPRPGIWGAVRDSLSGVEHDFTRGHLGRAIALLAIPMVLELCMESVFAVADIWFVGRLGSEAVAAVGLTESLLTLLYAVAMGLSVATTATIARRIGEGDRQGAARAATQAIALGIGVAIVVGVPGFLFGPELLRLMGASDRTVEIGGGYTSVLFGTNVVIQLIFLLNAVFRGAGDPALAMRSLWLANGINLLLDPCLIFGLGPFPELGVTGAAVATTCGRGVGVLYQLWMLRRGTGRIHLTGPALRLDPKVALRLVRISLGGIGQMLIATASWVALMRIMASFGDDALAGYTIAVRIVMFALLPAWGLSNAAPTLVGQNLGAGQPDRAEASVWLTGWYTMGFLLVVTVVFLLLAEPLVELFQSDAEVVALGSEALRVFSYGYIFYAWGMVMSQAINGAGDTVTPTWANFFCFWCCQIPLAWILSHPLGLGPTGVFWSVTGAETLLALVLLVAFRRGTWRRREV